MAVSSSHTQGRAIIAVEERGEAAQRQTSSVMNMSCMGGHAQAFLVNAGRVGQQALLNNGNVSKKSSVMNGHVRAHAPQIFSKCSIGVRVRVAVLNGNLQCGPSAVTALRCEGWCVSYGCNKMRARCKSHVCARRSLCASPF
jgi:hypothetical protein